MSKSSERQKKKILKELEITPIVQIACRKAGVGRATFYRWIKEDMLFENQVEDAREKGREMINDLAESQLINHIKNGDKQMLIYWLKTHHSAYTKKQDDSSDKQSGWGELLAMAMDRLKEDRKNRESASN